MYIRVEMLRLTKMLAISMLTLTLEFVRMVCIASVSVKSVPYRNSDESDVQFI